VLRLVEMSRRVTVWGIVTASDMAAFQAKPQVDPLPACRKALLAPVWSARLERLDLREVGAACARSHQCLGGGGLLANY
jgi:hypothetical protein